MNPGSSSAAVQFLLCKSCVQKEAVSRALLAGSLFVDLIGLRGKRLLDPRDKKQAKLAVELGIDEADKGGVKKRRSGGGRGGGRGGGAGQRGANGS